jgi:glycosyltransferase involved in cell wall biosynthesis
MKILVINWQDIKNPMGGGAEVHLHEIFSRVAGKGHDVTLFSCEVPGLPNEEIIDGIKVIRKGPRSSFNFYVKPEYKKRFSKENYDIVIDDINKIPFYTPKYVKEPLLAISHHFFGKSIFREANPIAGLYVFIAEYFVNSVYKNTPFAVVSESTLTEFIERKFNKKNFSIIPNAINQDAFPMKVGEKRQIPSFSYFGRLKKYKSVDHLLNAFAIAKKEIGDMRLDILGKGDFRDELEKLSKRLNIEDVTTFHGFVSEEDKARLLSESWGMVNTSMKEGWGITNIEANACGTPVISANVPGLRDSVKNGQSGLLYEYGNIKELAEILIKITKDKALRSQLSTGAVDWAREFSWDSSADMMIKKCEEVIRNHKK